MNRKHDQFPSAGRMILLAAVLAFLVGGGIRAVDAAMPGGPFDGAGILTAPVAADDTEIVLEDSSNNVFNVLSNDDFGGDGPGSSAIEITVGPTHGTAVVNDNGTATNPIDDWIEYTPTPDNNLADSLTYQICDATVPADCDTAVVNISITPLNDTPNAVDDTVSVAEDSLSIDLGVLGNDSFGGDGPGTIPVAITVQPIHGTAAVDDNSTPTNPTDDKVKYTPTTNYNGGDSLTYEICDSTTPTQNCDTAVVTITVTAVNDTPTANDDTVSLGEDSISFDLGVLGNDSFGGDGPGTIPVAITVQPGHGTAAVDNNSTPTNPTDDKVRYTPTTNYNGGDSLTYQICDSVTPAQNCDTAVVTITVTPVNDPPVITGQVTLSTPEDTGLTITLANLTVSDPDNTYPTGFTLAVQNGTNYTHIGNTITPALNFNGALTVPVTVNDGLADSAPYNLTVTVTPVNDPPVITGQVTLSTPEETGLTIILADLTVSDPDNTYPTGFSLAVQNGSNYTRVGNTITPALNFNGALTVPVTVNDGTNNSAPYNLTVTVTPVNDPPVITGQVPLSTPEDTGLTITLANLTVSDPDNAYPTGFTLAVQNGTNYTHVSNTITPALNYNGSLTVPVIVNDGAADSAPYNLTVTVTPVNDPPTAVTDTPTVLEDSGNTNIPVLANDYDVDLDTFNLTSVTQPPNGTSSIVGSNVRYRPTSNFSGIDSFTYTITDEHGSPGTGTVNVSVTAVNDPPVITGQVPLSTPEETALTIILADLTVSDPDNTYPIGFTLAVQNGTNYTHVGATITPALNFNGNLTVPVTVNDGLADSPTYNLIVTVTPVNDPPVITGQVPLSTPEDTGLTITLANLTVSDPDNTYPTGFTLAVQDGTNYTRVGSTITPALNFNGALTVPVTVNDGLADSAPHNLTVTVTVVNDPPVITGQVPLSTPEDTALTITLADLTVSDPDNTYPTGFSLAVQNGSNYTHVGNTITPALNFTGALTVPVTVNDGTNNSAPYNLAVTVTPLNDPPVITGQVPLSTPEETGLTITLADLTVSDPDNTYPTGFTLAVQDGSNYTRVGNTITPVLNFNGALTVPVTVNDGTADSAPYNLTVTVTPVNDPPVITGQVPLSTPEDTGLTITLANLTVSDPDNTYPTGFTLAVQDGTNYTRVGNTITPVLNFNGALTVPVTVNDGAINSAPYNLTVTVTVVNDPPVITGQVPLSTPEDTGLTITLADLTVSDSDNTYPTGFTLAVQNGSNYTHVGNTITPALNFNGALTVPVIVNDGTDNSAPFNLSVTVTPVNDPPVITGQVPLSTLEDTGLTITLANLTVSDPDNTYPTGFTLALQDGTNYTRVGNTITPALNFNGALTVPVTVNDGLADSAPFNLTVTVTPVNDPPVITGQVPLSTPEDTALTITLANLTVSDPDNTYPTGFTLAVQNGTNYTHVGNTITPALNFTGALTVPVTVNDGTNNSVPYNLTVTVTPVNDPPVITGQVPLSTPEDTALTITLANLTVSDPDNTFPTGFTLAVQNGTNYTHVGNTITPALNYNGVLTVPVTVNDGLADSAPYNLTVTVTPVNDPPVITGQVPLSTPEETALTITLANLTVSDPDNAFPTGFTLAVQNGTNYTHVGNTITPALNFNGALTVPVTVNDGLANSLPYNLTVSVTPVNDPPVITGQLTLNTPEDTGLTITLANLTVTDPDNTYPTGFTLAVQDGTNYTRVGNTITPVLNFNGALTVPVTVNDGAINSAPYNLTVTVTPVNDAPVAMPDSYTTPEETQLNVGLRANGVLNNDYDIEASVVSVVTFPAGSVIKPTNGTLILDTDGTFIYIPNPNYYGPDPFQYKITDGQLESGYATVSISVTNVNDAPVAAADSYSVNEDAVLTTVAATGVLANDTDADNLPPTPLNTGLTAVKMADPAHGTLTLNSDGSFTYTPIANYYGADSFTYKARDNTTPTPLESGITIVNLTINPIPDNPTAVVDTYNVNEDASLSVNIATGVLANDSDADNLPPAPANTGLTAIKQGDPTHATPLSFNFNTDGSFTYTPTANYYGPDSFTYIARDPTLLDSTVTTVTINVIPTNDLPLPVADTATTLEDTPIVGINVLANDSFGGDGPGTVPLAIVTPPGHGTATVDQAGTPTNPTDDKINYTPALNYNGADSLTYSICDSVTPHSDCVNANVAITVTAVNDPPVPKPNYYTLTTITRKPGTVKTLVAKPGVLANDTDPDNSLIAVNFTDPPNGSLAEDQPGTTNGCFFIDGCFIYTADSENTNGVEDHFTYQARENGPSPQTSDPVTVTIMVDLVRPSVKPVWVYPPPDITIPYMEFTLGTVNLRGSVPAGGLPTDFGYVAFLRWDYVNNRYVQIDTDNTPQIDQNGNTFTGTLSACELLLNGDGVNELFIRVYDIHGNYIQNNDGNYQAGRLLVKRLDGMACDQFLSTIRK